MEELIMTETIEREYYNDGTLREERTYEKDRLHGVSREWRKDGTLRSECTYEKGERQTLVYYFNEE